MSSRKAKKSSKASKNKRSQEEVASEEYQAPFSLHPTTTSTQDINPIPSTSASNHQQESFDQDEIVPSSPYFDDQEAREAMAWARGRNAEEALEIDGQEQDDDVQGAVSIGARKRRDSQVGSYDDQGSIFDGPSAGAVPSSISR